MQKRLFILIPLVIISSALITIFAVNLYKSKTIPKKVHYHAGFQVYAGKKLQDFSNQKYMKEVPCTVNGGKENHDEDIQLEKAHLHDKVGNVVHVERAGAKWKDLFVNIGYPFPQDKTLSGFINSKRVDNILDYPIRPYDTVIFILGKPEKINDLLKKAVTVEEIKNTEKKGESC